MADNGHSHEHGHGSLSDYTTAMVIFAVIGPAEIVTGLIVGNPTITSIGGHDAGDIAFPLIGFLVAWVSRRAASLWRSGTRWQGLVHSLACQLPVYTGIVMGIANIVIIGLLPLLTAPRSLTVSQALWGVGIGLVSCAANGYSMHSMRHVHEDQAVATRSHFKLDMLSAMAAIGGSLLTVWLGDIKWAMAAIGLIAGISLTETLPELRERRRRLHRLVRHPASPDHAH